MIKPLFLLLDVEKEGLQNYEALLALTNISSMSDSVRYVSISQRLDLSKSSIVLLESV